MTTIPASAPLAEAVEAIEDVRPRRFQSYADYKSSSVEWIDRVPSHWTTWKVTHGFHRLGSGTTPKSDNPEFYGGDIPWVTTSELRETVIQDTKECLTEDALFASPTLRIYPVGTLLFAMYGATIGRMGVLGLPATVNQACAAFVGPKTLDPWFTFYWLVARRPILIALSSGGGQPNLSQDDLRRVRIPAPPIAEQQAIVRFLDRETAKIDSLVAKKLRLVERLKEKRTTLISHAVTKGLNSDAPMKPSGVDWWQQVPAHWEFNKLGFMVRLQGGSTPSKSNDAYWRGDIPWVSPKDMKVSELADTEDHLSQLALDETSLHLLEPPVVLMVVRGMILAHTFPVSLTTVPVTINQDMKALTPGNGCSTLYLAHLLNGVSRAILGIVEESAHGTKVLRMPLWKHVGVFLPDETEQQEICEYINQVNARYDGLIGDVQAAIERLHEYRTALISAAVTGKIDVRKEVA